MKKLKQILSNKNTVTLIGAVLIVIVLYVFYNMRVSQATSPIKVPYAIQTIAPRTKITSDMIGILEVTQAALKGNIYKSKDQILNNDLYTNVNCTIPAGSLFFTSALIKEKDLPDSYLKDLEEGMIPYNFSVNMWSTYGNSIYPGNYVNIYFKGNGDDGLLMIGKLLENVKVLAVKDSSGRHVFENTSEARTPNQIIFQVPEEIHLLLRKAEYIPGVDVILVPNNTSVNLGKDETAAIEVTSETIKEYIESKATVVDQVQRESGN